MNRPQQPSDKPSLFGFTPLPALCTLAILYSAAHTALYSLRLVLTCPEGPARPLLFFAEALLLVLAPGFALLRAARFRASLPDRLLFVLATGLGASGLALCLLLLCGLLTTATVTAWLALCAAVALCTLIPSGGAASCRADHWARMKRALAAARRATLADALSIALLAALFESAAGLPFEAWDAVVSWDKWATDLAQRASLGGYLTGGYPLLLPLLHSVFYRLSGTAAAVLPPEQLLLRGFVVLAPAILLLALRSLGRRHGFSGLAAFLLFAASQYIFSDLTVGQADIPLAAALFAAAALLPRLAPGPRSLVPAVALFFPLLFVKGTGLPWAIALAVWLCRPAWGAARSRKTVLLALACALVAVLPFTCRQIWLDAHPAARELSPFLHMLPFKAAHTSIFTPNLPHFVHWMGKLSVDRCLSPALPPVLFFAAAAWIAAALLLCRKTRPLAVFCAIALAVWFFTASYDLRNAEIPLCLLAVVAALLAARAARTAQFPGFRPKAAALAVILPLLALTLPGLAHAPLQTLSLLARSPRPPKTWTADAPGRLRHFKPSSDLVNILSAAPYGASAAHILAGNRDYRLFAPRGVYAIQLNAFHDVHPGDLLLRVPSHMSAPPAPYLLAAALDRAAPHRELWLAAPTAPSPVPFTLDGDVLTPSNAPSCGLLELAFDAPPPDDATLSCDDLEGDPALFARYIRPARAANTLRLLYWTTSPSPPAFRYTGPPPASVRLLPLPL